MSHLAPSSRATNARCRCRCRWHCRPFSSFPPSFVNHEHVHKALDEDVIDVEDVEFVVVQAQNRRQLVVKA